MRYKIKYKKMVDGSERYYPLIKKHWWSFWTTLPLRKGYPEWCHSCESARSAIDKFLSDYSKEFVASQKDIFISK